MSDDKKIVNLSEKKAPSERVVKLKVPIEFDGRTVEEIDLGGLDNLTGKDLKELDRLFKARGGSLSRNTKELDSLYLQLVASRGSGMPIEFFESLSIKDATLVEVVTRNFLLL